MSITAKPMPNTVEKVVQNFPCTKYMMNQPASQSSPVAPGGSPSSRVPNARLKYSTFIRKMPSKAKPLTTSSASMRSDGATGVSDFGSPSSARGGGGAYCPGAVTAGGGMVMAFSARGCGCHDARTSESRAQQEYLGEHPLTCAGESEEL